MKTQILSVSKRAGLSILTAMSTLTLSVPSAQAGMMDDPVISKFTMDKLEVSDQEDNPIIWETDFWIMKGLQRLVIKSEGESVNGESESHNLLLYGQGIAPYWDLQLGLGYDTHEEYSHNWGVIGLSGMAPYFFETDAYALVDGDGTLGLRLSTEYEALITQRLILSPEAELKAYSGEITELKIGSGLSSLGIGLRLRYEFTRKFAPYVGIEWHQTFGDTADYHEEDQETSLVAGLRFWF